MYFFKNPHIYSHRLKHPQILDMENVWHLLNNNNTTSGSARGHNHHEWQLGHLLHPYNLINATHPTTTTTATHRFQDGSQTYAPMFPHHLHFSSSSSSPSTLFGTSSEPGGSGYYLTDPHLPSLKLGKRHYFENANNNNNNNNNLVVMNREQELEVIKEQFYRGSCGGGLVWQPPPTGLPRCQVDGCSVILADAKDYYKRHKVCEKHSKAPKVIVLGIEQRFCQQCSRFHAIGEFDESKRSCRRRLAGHNERRRKTSHHQDQSTPKNISSVIAGGCGHLPLLSTSSAHSHMSSRFDPPPDLSAQSSAALRELIVENRAAVSAWRNHPMEDQTMLQNHLINYFSSGVGCWEDMNAGAHLSLEAQAGSKFSI